MARSRTNRRTLISQLTYPQMKINIANEGIKTNTKVFISLYVVFAVIVGVTILTIGARTDHYALNDSKTYYEDGSYKTVDGQVGCARPEMGCTKTLD